MAKYIDIEPVHKEIDGIQTSLESNDDKKWYKNKPYYKALAMARQIMNEQPTADVVEVKRGEWMLHPDGSGTCSCCNRTQKSVWDYDNAQNFCGHCGADMRGDKK